MPGRWSVDPRTGVPWGDPDFAQREVSIYLDRLVSLWHTDAKITAWFESRVPASLRAAPDRNATFNALLGAVAENLWNMALDGFIKAMPRRFSARDAAQMYEAIFQAVASVSHEDWVGCGDHNLAQLSDSSGRGSPTTPPRDERLVPRPIVPVMDNLDVIEAKYTLLRYEEGLPPGYETAWAAVKDILSADDYLAVESFASGDRDDTFGPNSGRDFREWLGSFLEHRYQDAYGDV